MKCTETYSDQLNWADEVVVSHVRGYDYLNEYEESISLQRFFNTDRCLALGDTFIVSSSSFQANSNTAVPSAHLSGSSVFSPYVVVEISCNESNSRCQSRNFLVSKHRSKLVLRGSKTKNVGFSSKILPNLTKEVIFLGDNELYASVLRELLPVYKSSNSACGLDMEPILFTCDASMETGTV
jgi:hypothetical protein